MERFAAALLLGWGLICGSQAGAPKPAAPPKAAPLLWQATGTLLEVCSCSVPCPCNFGQSPSNDYCHTVYVYRLKTARYAGVVLDGLAFGGGEGEKGAMGYLDARATPAQRAVLEKLALAVFSKGGAVSGERTFTTTRVVAESDPQHFKIGFGETAAITADILMGRDHKNPIIVENNTTWPVHRFIKGKTSRFDYKDSLGNILHYEGVNANLGEFKLTSVQSTAADKPCCR
jgi:hypothetical protein